MWHTFDTRNTVYGWSSRRNALNNTEEAQDVNSQAHKSNKELESGEVRKKIPKVDESIDLKPALDSII